MSIFQINRSIRYCVFFLLLSLFVFLPLEASLAQQCKNKEGRGQIFYEFEKIYIYLSHVPSSEYNQENYPQLLNFKSISQAAQIAVKRNFSSCLVKNDGSLKPILVVDRPVAEMYNPENLTVVIKVNYYVPAFQKLKETKK